jgi:hypothetical protein
VYKLYSWKNKLPTKTKMHYVCLWLVLIYTFLIPYAIYTKTVTDHYLITSTNSGHVLFIGLGQLPNNKWGITPYDEDPKMAKIMEDELGQKDYGYNLQYEGDKILKKHFLNMIKEDPLEYTKKVFYSTYLMLKGGFYSGEYQAWVISGEEEKQIHMEVKESLKKIDLENIFVIFKKEGLFFALLYTLQKLINIYSRLLFAFFNLLLLFFLYKKFYQSNCFISIIFLSIVFYQFALCIFAYYMLIYITNLYLIYLFFIFWAIDCHIENKREKPF